MKILFFIHSMSSGGAERVTANLANEWTSAGHQVTVVTQKLKTYDFYPLNAGIHRVALGTAKDSVSLLKALLNNLTRVVALRRVIRRQRPDIVIGMMTTANVLVALAMLGTQVPTIVCERIYPPLFPLGRLWNRLRYWTYPLASRVVMLTSEGMDWLRREIPRARGVVMPNPVPYPLSVNAPELCPAAVVADDRKVLLAVGRMSEQKGFSGLIQAFSSLAQQHPLWDLVILGDGPLRPVLAQQVMAKGLAGRVLMPGRAGNVGAWYERADLYVLSSRVEGFPNTLGEAMAYGCAAVSFDCDTGPRDLIRHEVDGLLVPPGDVGALAQSLGRLMQDDALRAQMSARALEVRERYSMQRVLGLWDELFADVCKKRTQA
jgi:glycosyltransferase involved in cell wall biosynthesis